MWMTICICLAVLQKIITIQTSQTTNKYSKVTCSAPEYKSYFWGIHRQYIIPVTKNQRRGFFVALEQHPDLQAYINIIQVGKDIKYKENIKPSWVVYPSRCGAGANVTKNWEPFVLGPALAIDKSPRSEWVNRKFSSAQQGKELAKLFKLHLGMQNNNNTHTCKFPTINAFTSSSCISMEENLNMLTL